ncbi:hypothetical protein BC835DRAFT_549316 [Cytidiella melzeri]|nr:hypothetical protein BC835DRAFT_549316 [Cytidiella melzeri]
MFGGRRDLWWESAPGVLLVSIRVLGAGSVPALMRAWPGVQLVAFWTVVGVLREMGGLRGGMARSHAWEWEGPTMPNWRCTEGGSVTAGRCPEGGKSSRSANSKTAICMHLWVHTQTPFSAHEPVTVSADNSRLKSLCTACTTTLVARLQCFVACMCHKASVVKWRDAHITSRYACAANKAISNARNA